MLNIIKILIKKCPNKRYTLLLSSKIIYAQPTTYFQIWMLELHYLYYVFAVKNNLFQNHWG